MRCTRARAKAFRFVTRFVTFIQYPRFFAFCALILLLLQTVQDPTACSPSCDRIGDATQVSHGFEGPFAQARGCVWDDRIILPPASHASIPAMTRTVRRMFVCSFALAPGGVTSLSTLCLKMVLAGERESFLLIMSVAVSSGTVSSSPREARVSRHFGV